MRLSLILLLWFLTSCTSDTSVELGNEYFLVVEGPGTNEILNHRPGSDGIPPAVLRYGYNDRFIIAEQKPKKFDDVMHKTVEYKNGRDSIYYWIILKEKNEVIGPLTKTEFNPARIANNIPQSLELEYVYGHP